MSPAGRPQPRTAAERAARLAAERDGIPFLLFRDAAEVQQVIPLAAHAARLTVGRDAGNDLSLGWDEEVSRAHAELVRVGGEWAVGDQGLSRNGTFVNGQPVTGRRRLRDGDVMRLGRTLILYGFPAFGEPGVTVEATHAPAVAVEELSPTQRRVLIALCRPLAAAGSGALPASNLQIAAEVHLSVPGVKSQLRTLAQRLDCAELPQNRKRLVLAERAIEAGLGVRIHE